MQGRVIAMLLAFGLIVAAAGAVNQMTEYESRRTELNELRSALDGAQAVTEMLQGRLAEVTAKLRQARELVDSHEKLTVGAKALRKEVVDLELAKGDINKRFVGYVQEVRAKSIGMTWNDISTLRGQILQGVTVRNITNDDVTVGHSQGVAKLQGKELPPDMLERFRVGVPPMTLSVGK